MVWPFGTKKCRHGKESPLSTILIGRMIKGRGSLEDKGLTPYLSRPVLLLSTHSIDVSRAFGSPMSIQDEESNPQLYYTSVLYRVQTRCWVLRFWPICLALSNSSQGNSVWFTTGIGVQPSISRSRHCNKTAPEKKHEAEAEFNGSARKEKKRQDLVGGSEEQEGEVVHGLRHSFLKDFRGVYIFIQVVALKTCSLNWWQLRDSQKGKPFLSIERCRLTMGTFEVEIKKKRGLKCKTRREGKRVSKSSLDPNAGGQALDGKGESQKKKR